MKKLICTLLICFTFTSCGIKKDNQEEQAVESQGQNQVENNNTKHSDANKKDSFKVISPELYQDNVKAIIKGFQEERGFTSYILDDEHYIFIFAGKKTTGGYNLEVMEAYDKGDVANIIIKENKPDEKSNVTQAITYPSIAIKVTKPFKTINICTDEGEKFNRIEPKNKQ